MFIKKKLQKQDILQDIKEPLPESSLETIQKKPKIQQQSQPQQQEYYKANYTLQNQNQSSVLLEQPEQRPITNPVTETIQRLRSVHDVTDVKKGQIPKKNITLSTPINMPANIKFSYNVDYNPSLCKDYHDTGYCTFGDSCIYIHDRGDYKAGWEIEKEYQDQLKRKNIQADSVENEEYKQKLDELSVPEYCSICNEIFTKPVQTKCKHFFCEKCIMKKKKCPDCNKPTDGIFANANKLLKEMAEKRDKFIEIQQA